ncbi:putative threonine efflux protein [Sinorhizobium fredii CCBAU 83666]|nr:putative threonine efflux protein [Sinorhizobium fredii CCBAU 83666]
MPSTGLLITFLITTAVFAYVPGPAMLYAAAQTMARGRWSGLMATLGIHICGYVHVAQPRRDFRRSFMPCPRFI